MIKKIIFLVIVFLIWLALFFIPKTYAFAPVRERIIPTEIAKDPVKSYAYNEVSMRWGEEAWSSFNNIIIRESEWNPNNQNPTSSAYGLGQLLTSTRKWLKLEKTADPFAQVDEAIIYIETVYKDPQYAWKIWQTKSWY